MPTHLASRIDLDEVISPKGNTWHSIGTTPVYIYRSGWNYKTDTYLGVKGGTASTSHAHMDAGSFIYEQAGSDGPWIWECMIITVLKVKG